MEEHPIEILYYIFSFLEIKSLITLSFVCKLFNNIINSPRFQKLINSEPYIKIIKTLKEKQFKTINLHYNYSYDIKKKMYMSNKYIIYSPKYVYTMNGKLIGYCNDNKYFGDYYLVNYHCYNNNGVHQGIIPNNFTLYPFNDNTIGFSTSSKYGLLNSKCHIIYESKTNIQKYITQIKKSNNYLLLCYYNTLIIEKLAGEKSLQQEHIYIENLFDYKYIEKHVDIHFNYPYIILVIRHRNIFVIDCQKLNYNKFYEIDSTNNKYYECCYTEPIYKSNNELSSGLLGNILVICDNNKMILFDITKRIIINEIMFDYRIESFDINQNYLIYEKKNKLNNKCEECGYDHIDNTNYSIFVYKL